MECLKYGRSLDEVGPAFPWTDLIAILESIDEESPLYAAEHPDEAGWTAQNMLLADLVDATRVLIWQGGKRRKADYPKPIPRPGVATKDTKKFGNNPIEVEDMQAFLDRKRAGNRAA